MEDDLLELDVGIAYSKSYNKIIFTNDFIFKSGKNLHTIKRMIGSYGAYVSNDKRDRVYAKSLGIDIFDDSINNFDYTLIMEIDITKEIEKLKQDHPKSLDVIDEEFLFLKKNEHNILLLKMAFILKYHFERCNTPAYMMRGSGISSYILFLIGLNKVNPIKFNLKYDDFWKI